MKKLILGFMCAAALALAGCQKSVQSEMQDVKEVHDTAVDKIKKEQRDVEDAVQEGNKEIIKEKRDVEDAKVRDGVVPPSAVP